MDQVSRDGTPFPERFAPGTMLGKYELVATIGVGGMASVILARQRGPHGFEKAVVIKVIHPHMARDRKAVNMLMDEARLAAQINHHRVVQTYELGEDAGTYFIAMEYLEGESLTAILRGGKKRDRPLDPFVGARIVADAAEGLHAAHELTSFDGQSLCLVHRDVSPGNIVVLYNGGVKVVDFGVAKAHGRVTSTRDGALKGKYSYMSPEQIRSEPMDRRSDVFSLGVVLWEVLAQRRLFKENNVAGTLMNILQKQREPPSRYRPTVPAALDVVARRALSVEPSQRYQTAADMQRAIEDAIHDARVTSARIKQHMNELFAERIGTRRRLLAQVTGRQHGFTEQELAMLGATFDNEESSSSKTTPSGSGAPPPELPAEPPPAATAKAPIDAPTDIDTAPIPPLADVQAAPPAPPVQPPAAPSRQVAAPPAFAPASGVAPAPPQYPEASDQSRSRRNRLIAISVAATLFGLGVYLAITGSGDDENTVDSEVAAAAPSADQMRAGERAQPAQPEQSAQPAQPEPEPEPEPALEPPAPTPSAPDTDPDAPDSDPEPEQPTPASAEPDPAPKPKPDPEPKPDKPKPDDSSPATSKRSSKQLYDEATSLYLSGNLSAAKRKFQAALHVNRNYAPAHRGLGFVYQRTGAKAKALKHLRRYLKLRPNAKDADRVRARIEKLGG